MNHLKTLPITGERKFDGGDRYGLGGDEPPPETSSIVTFDKWMDDVLSRKHPPRHLWAPPGSRLSTFKIGAGSLVLVGAPPATGKTAFMLQVTVDAMPAQGQEGLKVLVANVEMAPPSLLDRMLARLSGVGYGFIQDRTYDEDSRPRIIAAMDEMRELMPRLMFLPLPFTLEHLSERALSFDADIVVVDCTVATRIQTLLDRCDRIRRGTEIGRPIRFDRDGERHVNSVAMRERQRGDSKARGERGGG